MAEKHLVKHWRGKRSNYNFLKSVNKLDPWTRYSVIEVDGSIVEYFGENQVYIPTGQLLPVKSILSGAPAQETIQPYDRYLIGSDGNGYEVYEYTPIGDNAESGYTESRLTFDEKFGVRVISEGLKNFVYTGGKLKTYDDVDCGNF